eukprot:gene29901-36106_t
MYDDNGRLDLGKTLYSCAENIPSVLFPASYLAPYKAVNVSVQLYLNSLLTVDDLGSSASFDFYWRILWVDPRYNIDVWDEINPSLSTEGIELTPLVRNEGNPLNVWLPDVFFFETMELETVDELIKLLPNGSFFWSRHIIAQLSQTNMQFQKYPIDIQNFSLTMQSFSYDTSVIRLAFSNGSPVLTAPSASNELWTFHSSNGYLIDLLTPSPVNPDRRFSTAYVSIDYERQPRGVIYRLALPVMIFLVVVGASFWAEEDKRIDISLQVLLLVSALYIVIGQSIPFVGYLTTMDNYMIIVFVLLAFTVSVHFLMHTYQRKNKKYPMDLFYLELILFIFRVLWVPMSLGLFTAFFPTDFDILVSITIIVLGLFVLYGGTKRQRLKFALETSVIKLRLKADLVKLGAVEEETGDPVVLERSEVFYLHLTKDLCNDSIYNELRLNADDGKPAGDLQLETVLENEQEEEDGDDKLSTSPQPAQSPHPAPSSNNYNPHVHRFNTLRSEQSLMSSSLISVYSTNNAPPGTQPHYNPASSAPPPTPLGRMGGRVDQVREMSLLLNGLKRQATLKQKEINQGEGGGGVMGKIVGGSEQAALKETVKEFKRVTMAEMGFVLPHQFSYSRPKNDGTAGVYKVLSKDDREI